MLSDWLVSRKKEASTRFVIMGSRRTGTNALMYFLRRHPAVLCHGEIFNLTYCGLLKRERWKQAWYEDLLLRDLEADQVMRAAFDTAALSSVNCSGFKFLQGQNPTHWSQVARDPSIRKICMMRRNGLKQYLSILQAHSTEAWLITDPQKLEEYRAAKNPLVINPIHAEREIKLSLQAYQRLRQCLERTGQNTLELVYEEDLLSPEGVEMRFREKVLPFLGLDGSRMQEADGARKTYRLNPEPVRELIQNFDEVAAHFQKTPHAWMLEE